MLEIEQEVSSVANTTSSSIDSPTIKQRKVKTTVLLNDGEALALGGMMQNQTSLSRGQLPLLGDIPVVGNVFKEKNDVVGKTELIIMIRPSVVRDLNQAQEVTEEYRRKFDIYVPHVSRKRSFERTFMRTLD